MYYPVLSSLTDWEFWYMPLHCNIGFSSQCGSKSTWWAGEQSVKWGIQGLVVCQWGSSCYFLWPIAAAQDPIYCHNYVNLLWRTGSVSVQVVWRSEGGTEHSLMVTLSNCAFLFLHVFLHWRELLMSDTPLLRRQFSSTVLRFFSITWVDMVIMSSFCW